MTAEDVYLPVVIFRRLLPVSLMLAAALSILDERRLCRTKGQADRGRGERVRLDVSPVRERSKALRRNTREQINFVLHAMSFIASADHRPAWRFPSSMFSTPASLEIEGRST